MMDAHSGLDMAAETGGPDSILCSEVIDGLATLMVETGRGKEGVELNDTRDSLNAIRSNVGLSRSWPCSTDFMPASIAWLTALVVYP